MWLDAEFVCWVRSICGGWGGSQLSGTDRCLLECLRTQGSFCWLKKPLALLRPFIFHLGLGHWLSEQGAIDIKPGHCLLFCLVSMRHLQVLCSSGCQDTMQDLLHKVGLFIIYVRGRVSFSKCERKIYSCEHQRPIFKNESYANK